VIAGREGCQDRTRGLAENFHQRETRDTAANHAGRISRR